MKLPVLVLVALLVAGCWCAGCTSASTHAPAKTPTEPPLGPVMTTPAVPVFTTPVIGGHAEVGITVMRETESPNSTSRPAPVITGNP
ncbi:MAG: hypothetical protein ABSG49_05535 [Methanoregula sp.]|uniref:hypothetical protein n=1 Tax=Methanoregula sp. TaxID=2052170 RepID=UPI003C24D9D1